MLMALALLTWPLTGLRLGLGALTSPLAVLFRDPAAASWSMRPWAAAMADNCSSWLLAVPSSCGFPSPFTRVSGVLRSSTSAMCESCESGIVWCPPANGPPSMLSCVDGNTLGCEPAAPFFGVSPSVSGRARALAIGGVAGTVKSPSRLADDADDEDGVSPLRPSADISAMCDMGRGLLSASPPPE